MLLDFIFNPKAQPANSDDFWYYPVGRKVAAGVSVTEDSAKNYSAVWAATSLLAGTGSSLPLNLIQWSFDNDRRKIRETAYEHPVHRLLYWEPNEEQTSMRFRANGIDRQLNWGNFIGEIEFSGRGQALAVHPIHPSRVTMKRDKATRQLFYEVCNDDGSTEQLMPYETFHVPSRITIDGLWGIGVISAARESIGMGIATEAHGAAYFGNGARPSGVLKHPGKIKDAKDRTRLRTEWSEMHGGPYNAGKPALLQEGMEYQSISLSPEDSQFLQTREHNIEEIARWYGIPPTMIGDLRRATFSNVEHQHISYVVHSLLPWLKLWEEEIWKKLLTPQEQQNHYAKHNVNALMRGDSAARASFYKAMWELGVFSTDDIRELEDLNPVEGGDVRYRPLNMGKLGTFDDPQVRDFDAEANAITLTESAGEVDAMIVHQTEPSDSIKLRAAVNRQLEADSRRMLTKEVNAVRRASKKPDTFDAKVTDFYQKHQAQLAEALTPAIGTACAIVGIEDVPTKAEEYATTHVTQSKDLLTDGLVGGDFGNLETLVTNVTADWEARVIQWEW